MNPIMIPVAVLALAVFLLCIWVFLLERRISRLLRGGSATTLEDAINRNQTELEELRVFRSTALEEIVSLDKRLRGKISGVRTLRFNPFQGTGSGGNQSFASAFLDEDGNGVVISSLYSREKVSVFAKPIKGRNSEFELTDEEREVLK